MRVAALLFLVLALSLQQANAETANLVAPASIATPSADTHIDTVNVEANKIPLDTAIHNFIQSYAQPTPYLGKMARWSTEVPLCPNTTGLTPAIDVFVTERIRAVAGSVGAPLQMNVPCKPNMVVFFTPHPQGLLDAIRKNRTDLIGYHFVGQNETITKVTHPIQAWYATASRDDNGVLFLDDEQAQENCAAIYGGGILGQVACSTASRDTLIKDGVRGEIAAVTVVVDNNKITGMQLGAVADYVSMLALSQTQAFETCMPLASIANLMTTGCDAQKSQSLTETDTAYLKALYKMDPDMYGQFQKGEIAIEMREALTPGKSK